MQLSRRLPDQPGAYAVATKDAEVLYVGKAHNLAERWGRRNYAVIDPRNCYRGGQSTNCRINSLIGFELAGGTDLELWFHETNDPAGVETAVYRAVVPPWNLRVL